MHHTSTTDTNILIHTEFCFVDCWMMGGQNEKGSNLWKFFVAISAPAVFILFFKYEYWQLKLWNLLYIPVCLGQALYIDTTLHVVPGSSSMVNFKSDETYRVKLFKGIFSETMMFSDGLWNVQPPKYLHVGLFAT